MMLKKKAHQSFNQFYCYEQKFRQENAHMQEGKRPISKRWSVLNNINNIISIDDNIIATSNTVSYEVRFWDINTKNLVYVLHQCHGWVRRILYSNKSKRLFILLSPNTMLIYKKDHSSIEFSLQQQVLLNSRCEILYSKNLVYYAGENSEIGVINLNNKKRLNQNFLNKPILSLEKWNNYIIAGSELDITFCSKINLQQEKIIEKAHSSSIHILKIMKQTMYNTDVLFSGSYDRTCKLWNPFTLELIKVLDFSADLIQVINTNQLLVHPFQFSKAYHSILLFDVNNAYNTHLLPFSEVKYISSFYYIQNQMMFIIGFKNNTFEVFQALNKKQNNKKRAQNLQKILACQL
ncbi:hypothetical protein TTHERM_00329730 (macronuclear) [Tetrahymena thermophila SB210]|uniref:WD domain, G-beta repeat protein n=1 Tax=Tetrahymena thermophila (strain SB210) TaxID=312017 RepID=I7MMS1_TETTS|nr:hypothetical protein TTHERM_00329730 [Tetrahymena thermophila SB210]EAS06293.2 hypothetical protein TTHERM_00329730 [Tetrahymena thermophila SB210]|eukprot:XP_001026538.2 hypothetical protein TTHERM_00329730 [Tetrahymena thermophila SB210]